MRQVTDFVHGAEYTIIDTYHSSDFSLYTIRSHDRPITRAMEIVHYHKRWLLSTYTF